MGILIVNYFLSSSSFARIQECCCYWESVSSKLCSSMKLLSKQICSSNLKCKFKNVVSNTNANSSLSPDRKFVVRVNMTLASSPANFDFDFSFDTTTSSLKSTMKPDDTVHLLVKKMLVSYFSTESLSFPSTNFN